MELKTALPLVALVMAGCASSQPVASQQPGRVDDMGCIAAGKVTPDMTPVTLYKGVGACVKMERYDDAALLMAVGGAYGRYDTMRVADVSAHQAVTVLKMFALQDVDEAKKQVFMDTFMAYAKPDGAKHAAMCARVAAVGKPVYHPAYMINHGIGAYRRAMGAGHTGGEPMVTGFNADTAWQTALDKHLHCAAE